MFRRSVLLALGLSLIGSPAASRPFAECTAGLGMLANPAITISADPVRPWVPTNRGATTRFELSTAEGSATDPGPRIDFAVPRAADVALRVYDLRGRVVARLHEGPLEPGRHVRAWPRPDELASGVYFVRLEADGKIRVRMTSFVR